MNDAYGSSIEKILFQIRLDENRIFNKHCRKVLEDKDKLQRLPESSILLCRKQQVPPGPRRAQAVHFRLAPLLTVHEGETSKQMSDSNAWTVTGSCGKDRFPSFPERTSSRQTWMRRMSLWKPTPDVSRSSPSPTATCSDSYPTSGSNTPLPVFRKREPTETFLIRRPTIDKPIPLKIQDEIFNHFVQSTELKALPFKKTMDSFNFYKNNFPLLLTKITHDSDRCSTPSRSSKTSESLMGTMINRKREMNQRIVELEFMMEAMEKETEDCKFVTELHSPVFDPTTWPWNVIDVKGLRRRYTIDASLKDT